MEQGFVYFHAACNHLRHLMIAVECLLGQVEDQTGGMSDGSGNLPEELMEKIVELSEAMTSDMENFASALFRKPECLKSTQQFHEVESACHEMLDAHRFVVQTGLFVASEYGHAPWIALALTNISARTSLIQSQLSEYAAVPPLLPA
jgi:hypothetical protein